MSSVYIALEGFQVGKCFVLKELHLLISDDEFKHFVFSAPDMTLDNKEQKTVRYCTRYLHGISWSAGDIPYDAIDGILRKYQTCTVYCYGYTSAGFLQKMLPTTNPGHYCMDVKISRGNVIPSLNGSQLHSSHPR